MNLFGKKKAAPEPAPTPAPAPSKDSTATAIAKLRDTDETIEKRVEHLRRKIDNENNQAKKLMAQGPNGKKQALTCMKRKKMYEKQIEQIETTRINLQSQQLTLENMNLQKEMLEAQRQAAGAMSAVTKSMGGVEAVDSTMDEMEDRMQDAEEIAEAMSRVVSVPGVDMDEEDLLAELAELEQADLEESLGKVEIAKAEAPGVEMPSVPENLSMPAAPTSKPQTQEEKELAELEASMAM